MNGKSMRRVGMNGGEIMNQSREQQPDQQNDQEENA
jgi:hypothetical protein